MSAIASLWEKLLPDVRNAVTGVGVWSALNKAVPITHDDQFFVIGMPHEASDLSGHLRMQQTKTLIERMIAQQAGLIVQLRVIEGTTVEDWESIKRRDAEARRLQDEALNRQKAEIMARGSWDTIYDQISRKFASIQNKSLPQNRALFVEEAIDIILDGLQKMPIKDDLAERNFARCIDRVAGYAELPSTYIAIRIRERSKN